MGAPWVAGLENRLKGTHGKLAATHRSWISKPVIRTMFEAIRERWKSKRYVVIEDGKNKVGKTVWPHQERAELPLHAN